MNFQKIVTLAMALAMLVLSQHSLPSQGMRRTGVCEYSREMEQSRVGNVISPEDIRNLISLADGSKITHNLGIEILPRQFRGRAPAVQDLMKSATALWDHMQRLKTLLALPETHKEEDHKAVALEVLSTQLLLEKYVKKICSLFPEISNCSYEEVRKLKFKLDAYDIATRSYETSRKSLMSLAYLGRRDPEEFKKWTPNILVCSLSDEELTLVNHIRWLAYSPFNKDCCIGSTN